MSSLSLTKESSVQLLQIMKRSKAVDIKTATDLLQNYADPNHREETGKTITHFAAENCHFEVLGLILSMDNAQKYVDQRDNHGMNVFHFAAVNINDDIKVIDALFENQSIVIDVDKRDKLNRTALDIAKECKKNKIVNYLESKFCYNSDNDVNNNNDRNESIASSQINDANSNIFHSQDEDEVNDRKELGNDVHAQNMKKEIDLCVSPNVDHCDVPALKSVHAQSENSKEDEMKKPYIMTSTDNESSNSLTRVLYETKEENGDGRYGKVDCSELWKAENIKKEAIKEANEFVEFYEEYLYQELDNIYLKVFEKHDLNCLAILDVIDDDILHMAGIKKRAHRRHILKQIQKYLDDHEDL